MNNGRKLLRDLLPWARAEARKGDVKYEDRSLLGRTTMSYVAEDNLEALSIYPAPMGGWHADLVLKHVPPGVPNVIGSPVGQPHATRAAAEASAKALLVGALTIAKQNREATVAKRPPVFILNGWSCELLPRLYEAALKHFPSRAGCYSSKETAVERIEEVLQELCPDGFDGKAFNGWGAEKKSRLLGVLHVAALTGIYVYPLRRDATPSGHEAPVSTRH